MNKSIERTKVSTAVAAHPIDLVIELYRVFIFFLLSTRNVTNQNVIINRCKKQNISKLFYFGCTIMVLNEFSEGISWKRNIYNLADEYRIL